MAADVPEDFSYDVYAPRASVRPGVVSSAPWPDPIPGIIPFGTLTILAGASSVGKSTLRCQWMRAQHTGHPICGYPTNPPTHFYYVVADRGLTEEAFFAKLGFTEHVTFYSVVDPKFGHDPEAFHQDRSGHDLLLAVIDRLNPIPGSHVIIDPLAPLFITGNQNRVRDVAASLIRMTRVIKERQINLDGIWHFGKQKADANDRYKRPQDRISGSGAVSGFSDTQIYLIDQEPPKQPYYVLGWNPRERPPEEFKVLREANQFVPYVGLDEVGIEAEPDRPTQVLWLLPEEGLRFNEWEEIACNALTISGKTFEMHFATLKKRGLIAKDIDGRWHRRKVN